MDANFHFPAVEAISDDDPFEILYCKPKRIAAAPEVTGADEKGIRSKEKERKSKLRQGSYEAIGLSPPICKALTQAGYNFPTPIQREVIPAVLNGHDVVAMARTGSGKTAAFLAPLLHRLEANPLLATTTARNNGPRALVIAPTRELVLQELKFCRLYAKHLKSIRTAVVVGGTPLDAQFAALAVCPDIIFATPGRLLQILAEMGARGGLTISTTEMVVFDEADRLFEGTLALETYSLLEQLKDKTTETLSVQQTVLVSATMPNALAEFSRTGLRDNLKVIRLDVERTLSPTLASSFVCTRADLEKDAALQVVLRKTKEDGVRAIVFAATHRRVEYLTSLVKHCIRDEVWCIHGNMDQVARQEAVKNFRKKQGVLVVTDVAARGIDIPELDAVINYDMPATPKLFVHRVGRAGRAGKFGMSISLVAPDEIPYMLDLFLFLGRGLKVAETTNESNQSSSRSHAYMIESSFIIGTLPKSVVDEEVEITRNAMENVDIEKAHRSARNAQKLYMKTRGAASGESVKRGKEWIACKDGGRRYVPSHPWFQYLESVEEQIAAEQAACISTWRPKESIVLPPLKILARKRYRIEERKARDDELNLDSSTLPEKDSTGHDDRGGSNKAEFIPPNKFRKVVKQSARQKALEAERLEFFLPTRQNSRVQQLSRGLKVRGGGAMGDDLRSYKDIQDAVMDINGDENAEMLRTQNTGANSTRYWDRVSKRFVKGGVTNATSKRNLHVATKEARLKSKTPGSYGTEDGQRFKNWLSKNRKTMEQLSEQVSSGTDGNNINVNFGLGGNDFRKGAFGRRARVAAASKQKHSLEPGKGRSELKNIEQIQKARKLKAKAEAKKQAQTSKKRAKGGMRRVQANQQGPSRSKLIIRRKK